MSSSSPILAISLAATLLGGCATHDTPETTKADTSHRTLEQSAAARFLKPNFHLMDCEGYGQVRHGEAGDHVGSIFFTVDTDRSLMVTREEYEASMPTSDPELDDIIFKALDANGNGSVTPREFMTYLEDTIGLADINGDGMVDRLEIGYTQTAQVVR